MKRFDKLKNIKKVNILAEQRYKLKLNESTDSDLINLINQKIGGFSKEDGDFDDNKFTISLINDRIEGIVINGVNVNVIAIDVAGSYRMTSAGYYRPGKYHGPPEDSYPDESENPEFDIVITDIKIGSVDEDGNTTTIMELSDSNVQKMPKSILAAIEDKVVDMFLDSDRFDDAGDEPDRYDDYDDY